MSKLTIQDVKDKKQRLYNDIIYLLDKFEEDLKEELTIGGFEITANHNGDWRVYVRTEVV
jgi:hypothetical protein